MVLIFDKNFSEELIEEISSACVFYADHLFSKKLEKHILVEFVLRTGFKDHGDCEVIEYNSQNKPRHFKIRLRKKKSIKSTLKTVAHELVHVKQFAKGELSEYHDKWEGVDHSQTEYHDLPWEIEARTLEHILFDKYITYRCQKTNIVV
jgi:hypothetical protein